jgi:hypothetical protein
MPFFLILWSNSSMLLDMPPLLVLEDRKVEYAHILRKRYNDMGENID